VLKQLPSLFRAIALVAIVCIALIAFDSWRSWNARSIQLQEMDVATSNLANAMAQQADDTIKEADTTLAGIVERVEYEGTNPATVARLHKLLVARTAELPQLNGLFIYDENGRWIADSQPTLATNFNNSDREYFAFHRAHADLGPHISAPVISRSTGKWIIPVSRRINHADGSFGGVALATINVDFFTAFYDSLHIGQAGALALISENGIMMVRRPFSDSLLGKNVATTDIFRAYSSQGTVGPVFITSAQDGVTRLNSYRRLKNYPLFVTAALSKNEILTEWRRDTVWHTSGVIFLAMAVALFGWRLVIQIELRNKAEAETVRARDALQSLNQTLKMLAMQDGLTGLANRRQFDATLGNEFGRAIRNASTLALIMLDVDCFKQYNEIYGHAAGDECLRTISRTIKDVAPHRPGDLVARYGGEEIAVLLPNTDVAGALVVAEKIRNAIRNLEIEHTGNLAGFVTLSAGVDALVPIRGSDVPTVLIQAADKALYSAKAAGRNRVCTSVEYEA